MNLPIHGVLAARNLKVCTETHLYWGPRSNKQACVVAQPPWTFSDESRLTRLCTNIKSQLYDPSPSAASMPTSTRRTFPTINISITHHCSSCDFDEGEDNNKGLLQGALQMMNPSTSFRTAFDDFTPGKECKQWKKRTGAVTERFLSHTGRSRFTQWPLRTTSSLWCYINKYSIKTCVPIWEWFEDLPSLISLEKKWHVWGKQQSWNMRS